MNQKLIAVAVATLLVVSTAAPAVAAEDGLAVSVTQAGNDADVTISVTDNGSAVPNASVDVEALTVLRDSDGETEANETEDRTEDVTIGGTYETDANGTVTLDAPERNVRVSVTATVDDRTASTTTVLEGDDVEEAFGQQVQAFVHRLLASSGPGIGPAVSEFVTENNPGADNRPDHAGPPAHAGPGENVTDDDDRDKRGPPEHAGAGGNEADDDDRDKRGPPEHAGAGGNEADDDRSPSQAGDREQDRDRDKVEEPDQDQDRDREQDRDLDSTDEEPDRDRDRDGSDEDDDDEQDDDGEERGPPDHAGPPN
ncbi:hypothetical protein [Halorhabdus amylolytica]|uniref:hypothetical protein n=1 Tax=Halorhabdus amylolytica TaxID=2559573 RepID=UPI0010AA1CE5|nr:hypothetical protein [Halorhabdus amylolytica]